MRPHNLKLRKAIYKDYMCGVQVVHNIIGKLFPPPGKKIEHLTLRKKKHCNRKDNSS